MSDPAHPARPPEDRDFVRGLEAAMDRMMRDMHAAAPTGEADVDFLAMMIPHHLAAVEMARLLLVHGKDPLARQLAEDIIVSQSAEIAAMRRRLAILRRAPDPEPGGFPALQGTRGARPKSSAPGGGASGG